jgi:hypothetical protein
MRLKLALLLAFTACASAPPPQPVTGAPDNGQPKMRAAWSALQQAKGAVQAAEANKGGHRERAIEIITQAIEAVDAGMRFAAAHPTEIGEVEPVAAAEPVDENVAGAERQPRMRDGIVFLREARRQLNEAKHDKGGFRVRALGLIQQAIVQLREGINFANAH